MKNFFIILFFLFAFLFLGGCTLNPNKNLIVGDCCAQSNDPNFYSCKMEKNPLPGTTDIYRLLDCGDYESKTCAYFNSTSGQILDSSKNVIKDSGGNSIKPNLCSKNCNFDQANCTNEDQQNTCYSLSDPKITYPICVNNSNIICIQNECKIWMCGEKKPIIKREYSFSNSDQETLQNNYKSQGSKGSIFNLPIGLVGKLCQFRIMNASSYRLLSQQKWLVNNLKLGVLGSFSDYEIARYYFPPSDAFCSPYFSKDAVVDSFIRYLEYQDSSFKKKLPNFCTESNDAYVCKYNQAISFPKSVEFSNLLCNSFCSKLFNCPLNNLNFSTTNVTPPGYSPTIEHYLLNSSYLLSELLKLYPDNPDNLDYYRKEGEKGIGPEGAKAFECLSDSNCMSGICRKDFYFRGRCFDASNQPLDCNCTLLSSCKEAFKCDSFSKDSIDEAQCQAGKFLCLQNSLPDEPIVVCKYPPTTYPLYAYKDLGKTYLYLLYESDKSESVRGANSWDDNSWGVYDFAEFNKYKRKENGQNQQLEFANIVRRVVQYGCLNKVTKSIENPICDKGSFFDINKKKCIGLNNGQESNPTCKNSESKPKDWIIWKDNAEHLWHIIDMYTTQSTKNSVMRWQWGYAFFIVPQNLVVSSTLDKPSYIITSRTTTFDNLKAAFPFIEKCGLTHTNNIDYFGGDFDILEVSIKDIPLEKHELIEQYVPLLKSHPYLLAGGKNLEFGEQEKKSQYLFDKTWIIKNFGKCQKDSNLLKTKSYGLCDSCGTVLTLAYQNVSKTKNSYCPKDCGALSIPGQTFQDICLCSSSLYPFNTFISNIPNATPSTIPEFSYLTNKIHSYLEANIIPVLDLKEYAKDGISIGEFKEVEFDYSAQNIYTPLCKPDTMECTCEEYSESDGSCIAGKCKCLGALPKDALFLFLNKNHNAVISILDKLSSPSVDGKINNAKLLCPNCIIALEYEPVIDIDSSVNIEKIYSESGLNDSITSFFGVKFPKKEKLGFPPIVQDLQKIEEKNVDLLVLNLRFTEINENNYKKAVENAANLSRYILHHVGKPTLIKLRFDGKFSSSPYVDPVFLDTLFIYQNNLTLSGVVGILLPSLLEKNENVINNLDVSSNNEFCSLVNGSLSILKLSFNNQVKKLQAQDGDCNLACVKCPPLIASDSEACNLKCSDGSSCSQGPGFMCPKNCISKSYCKANKCEDKFASQKITCYYMPSYSKYFNYINKLEINTFDDLSQNLDMPEILAALNEKCCLNIPTQNSENYYTYHSDITVNYGSSAVSYPSFGSNSTSCGQILEGEEQDPNACTTLPDYVYSKKLYYCFWENK